MSIKLLFSNTGQDLTGQSKIWGCPDLPDTLPYPEIPYEEDGEKHADPMSFICQIRLEDIADIDRDNILPHQGMLYFFGEIDYFLGNFDAPNYPGMGEWSSQYFRVLYSPSCDNLNTHSIVDADGELLCRPAESISFYPCNDGEDDFKLLGRPFFSEVEELYPSMVSLFQMDCNDNWNLMFHDSGMLNFLISPDDLKNQNFNNTICYLHSF